MNLRFLYVYCNDLAAMRHFYTDLLQLAEIYYAPGPDGGLAYRCDALQFTIFPAPAPQPVVDSWQMQPGWPGGTQPTTSWSLTSDTLEAFAAAVDRVTAAGVPAYFDRPQWFGYWSFPVRDPMGHTVELTFAPDADPPDTTWR